MRDIFLYCLQPFSVFEPAAAKPPQAQKQKTITISDQAQVAFLSLRKIMSFCLFLRGKFFTFNEIIFYNARDIKVHQRKQTAFRG